MKKKLVTILLLLAVSCSLLTLTGCGEEDSQTYAWVLATASTEDTVTGIFANRFAELVEELSDGEMRVQVYHNSTLGGDTELIESVMCGDIPFVIQNTAPQVSYLPRLCLFDLPMVFDDIEELREVLDNEEFIEKINDIYNEKDLRLLAMGDQDFRVMTSNVYVDSMDDFSGIKIRTMENNYHMAFWTAIGASPTPMAFSELYVGLEQHTVDAQENPYEVIVSNKFYEVQDYVIQTNHLPHLLSLITNEEFYQSLTEEQQAIIDQAAEEALVYSREQVDERSADRIASIEASGTEIVALSDELRQEMKEASADLYERIREVVDDDELFNFYIGED